MSKKYWVHTPHKAKPNISESEKNLIKEKCDKFIDSKIKPGATKPFNPKIKKQQCVDNYCKWYRNYIYFISEFKDTRDDIISPEYEDKYARLQCIGKDKFLLSYMRHTGVWFELTFGNGFTLNQCFERMLEMPHFFIDYLHD